VKPTCIAYHLEHHHQHLLQKGTASFNMCMAPQAAPLIISVRTIVDMLYTNPALLLWS
jgi:hypothetical protein